MKLKYVSDLAPGDKLSDIFLVTHKELKPKKDGSNYLYFRLTDKTGSINAQLWDGLEKYSRWPEKGDHCLVKGAVKDYKSTIQVTISEFVAVKDKDIEKQDYLPPMKFDPEETFTRLKELLEFVKNAHLRSLIDEFLKDTELVANLKKLPAGSKKHHAYPCGLMIHMTSMLRSALQLCQVYPELDKDVLLTGIFIHDIGKTRELTFEDCFSYSDEGELLGHIGIGVNLLERMTSALPGFPGPLKMQLEHIILSHHGEYEYGAPVLPKTKEALTVHFLDNLDSKLDAYKQSFDNLQPEVNWSGWTGDRKFYRPSPEKEPD